MIAEKTADAIKGRKLAPFEPPTRIATSGGYRQHYAGKLHASGSAIQYKFQQQPQYYVSQKHNHQQQYPPPIGQQVVYPQAHLSRSLAEELAAAAAASAAANATTLFDTNMEDTLLINNHKPRNADYTKYMAGSKGELESDFEADDDSNGQDSNIDFMLKRYGTSKLTESFVKRISPIR